MLDDNKKNQWWRDDENILILNAGAVTLAVPRSWLVEGKAEGMGHMEIKDPSDSCALQISCMNIPPLLPTAPPADQMLRDTVSKEHPSAALAPIVTFSRGHTEIAWMDYSYDEKDTDRDEWRVAHARPLFAWNKIFGALLTFAYWEDDTSWAVPAWERMVETLHLGDRGLLTADPRSRRN
jgi:hypothetical protein